MTRDRMAARRRAGLAAILATLSSIGACAALARQDREALLRAGFKQLPSEKVEVLPANTFTHRSIGGADTVLYSDPTGCHCVYEGSAHDYQVYFDQLEAERAQSGGP